MIAFCCVAIAVITNSCRRDNYQVICYGSDVQPIFNRSCNDIGCHSAGSKAGGYDFTTYDGAMKAVVAGKSNKSSLYESIRGLHPEMPQKGNKLSKKEVSQIKSWIDFGAQNCTNTLVSNCDTGTVTYSNQIKSLMEAYCNSCHFTGNPTPYTLDNHSSVVAAVNSNKLIPSIKFTGNPMPQGGQKLSDCNIRKIEKWIASGMPNN